MSSAFGDWKVNSSFLTVTNVNVWEKALLLLKIICMITSSTHKLLYCQGTISFKKKTVHCMYILS